MEKRFLLTRILRSLFISPYDWRYTLCLPYYLLFPSEKKHVQLTSMPAKLENVNAKSNVVKFVFAGDIMLLKHNRIPQLSSKFIKVISHADYFAANCEAPVIDIPLNPKSSSLMTFAMPFPYLEKIFEQLPIDRQHCILSVANNHSRDITEDLFDKGVALLRNKLNLHVIGRQNHNELPFARFQAKNGLNFAISAWTHLMNGERFLEKRRVVNRDTDIKLLDWNALKKIHNIDFLIGMLHWGHEFQHYPYSSTVHKAKNFINKGFDLLIGSHGHVLQPLSLIKNKLCCFSLGNFCSLNRHWRTKLIPLFEIDLTSMGEVSAYQLHFFMQMEYKDQVYIEPLEEAPYPLQTKVNKLLNQLFSEKYF